MAKDETPAPVAFTQEQFTQMLAAIKDSSASGHNAELRDILLETAKVSAQTMKKALKPENDTHPGISACSYPEGDVAKPRPHLPYDLIWNGAPLSQFPETLHWFELELLCQLKPGEYHVSLTDMNSTKVSIQAGRDASGKITKLEWVGSMSREETKLAAPIAVQAYQVLHAERPLTETYLEGTTQFLHHVVMNQPVREVVTA